MMEVGLVHRSLQLAYDRQAKCSLTLCFRDAPVPGSSMLILFRHQGDSTVVIHLDILIVLHLCLPDSHIRPREAYIAVSLASTGCISSVVWPSPRLLQHLNEDSSQPH